MYHRDSLMTELGITIEDFYQRMEFIGLTEDDLRLLSEMGSLVRSEADLIINHVHERLRSFDQTRAFFENQPANDLLLIFQKDSLLELFQGHFNDAYVEKQLSVGAILHQKGLAPKWYLGAQSIYENQLTQLISRAYENQPDRASDQIIALQKVFFLNTTLTLDFYRHRLTMQLEEKIRDLDEFTYVVSHDLKEPLRGIEAFSTFLIDDYSKLFDEKGKQYLDFLRESAVHLKELIHDLLMISSISKQEPKIQRISLSEILTQILHDLKFSIQQKNAEIRIIPPLPTLYCDPIQIGQVFQNLISNAIKFNISTPPQVEIEGREQGMIYLFSVRDNGIGIDPRYAERVFQLFERLHQKEEFEGTGAGLAICKKIIERFGGDIKVESQLGKGSAFYFTLPKIPAEKR